jgi:hypothetical protein
MTRLLRILFKAATVLSLMLCVTTAVLWVRSYRLIDMLTIGERRQLSSWLGGLHYYAMDRGTFGGDRLSSAPLPSNLRWDGGQYSASGSRRQFHGFIVIPNGRFRLSGGVATFVPLPSYTAVRVPTWAVMAITLVLPIAWLIHYRGRIRVRCNTVNSCPRCGYDLRATPERCPECGAVPIAHDARSPKPRG